MGETYVASKMDSDMTVMKYDKNGKPLWVDLYSGPGNSTDIGFFVAVDPYNNIYASGWSVGTNKEQDAVTIGYAK